MYSLGRVGASSKLNALPLNRVVACAFLLSLKFLFATSSYCTFIFVLPCVNMDNSLYQQLFLQCHADNCDCLFTLFPTFSGWLTLSGINKVQVENMTDAAAVLEARAFFYSY